ncbi:MAG: 4-hydroxy-3-methylbut-2-enyl diphosphate reductase [Thermodesulfobacteriota bacterium]
MKVILAKKAGFCMGVRRAVETVLDTLRREEGEIKTFGPLIHNPQVLEILRRRGVAVLKAIPDEPTGTIVIRAHGVPPETKAALGRHSARVVDATCPRVIKVQAIIRRHVRQGATAVIIGDPSHAEVGGLLGHAAGHGLVVASEADVAALTLAGSYIVVSQTTQDEAAFQRLTELILARFPGGRVFNTICDSTHKRQAEVRRLCQEVEAVVVVGGKNSANTQRLAEIAGQCGRPAFLVETERDLDVQALSAYDRVGVTAGASTPNWLINRVAVTLESLPGQGEGALYRFGFRLFRLLLDTNLFVSVGGSALAWVCARLQGLPDSWQYAFAAFGYLLAMHNLNRFTGHEAAKLNDPFRARLYETFRWPLLLASMLALVVSLAVAFVAGPLPFVLLVVMSALGIAYSVPLVPPWLRPVLRVRGLREIPGSKTAFVATAWALVTAVLPVWISKAQLTVSTGAAFVVALLVVYIRSALFDVFEVQGDRIVGKETLPVFIGEKKTLALLHWLLGILVLLLVALPLVGWLDRLAWWLVPVVGYLGGLIHLYGQGRIRQGPRTELLVDAVLFLVAGLVLLGSAVGR